MHQDRDVAALDPILRRNWHVVGSSGDLPENGVMGAKLLGITLVLYRVNGEITAAKNLCMHRGSSFYDLYGDRFKAVVDNGCIVCPYHSWRYDKDGQCVFIPALEEGELPPKHFQLIGGYHVCERYGTVRLDMGVPRRAGRRHS
jgi:phenylpropionate dioxygenase-like ring-hydroxylating dioxygenase large terminal subunit